MPPPSQAEPEADWWKAASRGRRETGRMGAVQDAEAAAVPRAPKGPGLMEAWVLSVALLQVSQHALGGLVEVHEGAESVLLPCDFIGNRPEDDPHLMWTREDLSPKGVHLQRAEKDDLTEQNRRFWGRTAMTPDALHTGNFSLTLRNPRLTDSGDYSCSISDGRLEDVVAEVQLKVKANQEELGATEGAESVLLPCRTAADLPAGTTVEWTLAEPEFRTVHVFSNKCNNQKTQSHLYCSRTEMKEDLLRTGDLSLTLRQPTVRDSGSYICTVYRDQDILRQRVALKVKAPFPVWIPVIFVVAAVLVAGSLFIYFYFLQIVQVTVDSGVASVRLPCRALLHKGTKVEWMNDNDRKVHVSENGTDQPAKEDLSYRNRTRMDKNFGLILRHPTDKDGGLYTCSVYHKNGKISVKKKVVLKVRVPQMAVDYLEVAVLPCRATDQLPGDATVEWRDDKNTVMYGPGQDQYYRGRTEMDPDPLGTGNLGLIIRRPKYSDTLTCSVYSRGGDVLLRKQVKLTVRACQVEAAEGAESVQLPFQTTANLPEDTVIVWERALPELMGVHKYQKGSNQADQQHQSYRGRTSMSEDPLGTGDLSLTLKGPTAADSGEYRCWMASMMVWREITIQLTVTERVLVLDPADERNPLVLLADQQV